MNEGFRSLPQDVQKKILGKAMGGVMQRPLFRQMGGPAQPMPQDMMSPAEPAAQAEMQGQAVGQEVAARTMGNIDAATDVKTAIDALRGNAAPLEARYQELANFVGERDASQTPESVLALTQPAIMMTEQGAMDSGIGELMQKVAGDTQMDQGMDQGLGGLMMQGAGNTPPQNFRQGGPVEVRHFKEGTPPTGNSSVPTIAKQNLGEYQTLFSDILGSQEERAAELERDRQRARSDAMFNLANFGLAFAGETQGSTVAERLANAATRSNVVGGFQQAGKDVAAAQKALRAEDQQMSTAALQAALTDATRQATAADALTLATAKKKDTLIKGVPYSVYENLTENEKQRLLFGDPNGVNGVPRDIYDALSNSDKKLVLGTSALPGDVKGVPKAVFDQFTDDQKERFLLGDPQGVNGIPRDLFDLLGDAEKKYVMGALSGPVRGIPAAIYEGLTDDQKTRLVLGDPQGVNGIPRDIFDGLDETDKKSVLGTAPEAVKGVPRDIFDGLTDASKDLVLGIDKSVKGVPASVYNALTDDEKKKFLGVVPVVADKFKTQLIDTAEGPLLQIINERTGQKLREETFDPVVELGGLVKFTIQEDDGSITETVETLGSKAGIELQKRVNEANKAKPGSATLLKVGTQSINPQAYLTDKGQVITSFDSKTFTDPTGKVQLLTDVDAKLLGNTNVYEIIKSRKIADYAKQRIEQRNQQIGPIIFKDENNEPLPAALQDELRQFLQKTSTELLSVSENDIKKGTGLLSNAFAMLNAVGGTVAPEAFDKVFGGNAKARKNLGLFNFVAVSAMARNPRYAVYDMQQVKENLINPKNLVANTASEAKRFRSLVALMVQERNAIESALQLGDPKVMDEVGGALAKLKEIDFVLSLVRLDPRQQGTLSLDAALEQTEDEFE